jgi:hypothetical protein
VISSEMPKAPTILLFDSGLGGLTVFQEVRSARPDANFIYVADDAGFPYGNFDEDRLIERVIDIAGRAISDSSPDLVVVACNTASTLALGELRAHFRVPFVGTVPAIKPACVQSTTKRVAVLGTQATVGREYTHALIREFGSRHGSLHAPKPNSRAPLSPTRQLPAKSRAASSTETAGAPTRSCSLARTIRFCSSASVQMHAGRSYGSTPHRLLPAAW